MPRVLVSDTVSERGLEILRRSPGLEVVYNPGLKEDELAAAIESYDALVIRSGSKVTAKVIERASRLKVIGRAGIGVDNVDVAAASKRGIVVMNTPTGNAVTTAEHAISLMFAIARHIPQASASMKLGKWEKTKFSGRELSGKTLGVLGLGNIGRIVAERARSLRLNVIAYDPVLTADNAASLGVETVALDEVWRRADIITVHTPLTAQTKGIVNDASIAQMKRGVLLVNAARGGIYDEGALLRGLERGHIGGVALDVFEHEPPKSELTAALIRHELVVATPHLGASTEEAQERVVLEIAEQVVAYLASGAITNAVNVPCLSSEVAAKLAPYLDLAMKMGSFVAQVSRRETETTPKRFEVHCHGDAASVGTTATLHAALAGYLCHFHEGDTVNSVSAPVVAKARGIELKTIASPIPASVFRITVVDSLGASLSADGTLAHDGTPRLTSLMGLPIDAHLSSNILVTENEDRPGVIGLIGTILGRREIGVSRMQLGLDANSKRGVALWAIDSPISADLLSEVRMVGGVHRAVGVSIA